MSPFDLNSLFSAVFAWTWKTSLAVTVLIGLVFLVQLLFRKTLPPRWSYALWMLVVLRMMMPVVPSSRFSIFNMAHGLKNHFLADERSADSSLGPQGRAKHSTEPKGSPNEEGSWRARDGSLYEPSKEHDPNARVNLEAEAFHEPQGRARHSVRAAPMNSDGAQGTDAPYLTVAQWAWLFGAIGYFLTVVIRHGRLASWVKRQPVSTDPRVRSLLEASQAALGLSRNIDVIESNRPGTAAIFGYFKPRLLLPRSMLERLSTQELRLVILHELVHVRRRDVLLNWLLIALQSLHWFNPAVWLALRRLKADRELVCDAAVMAKLAAEDRHVYGNTLIKLLDESAALAPSLVPIIHHKHEIQRRITMIAQFKPTSRVVSIASAMLLLALGCFTFTGVAEKDPPPKTTQVPKAESELEKQRNAQDRGLKTLEEEWAKQDNLVRMKRQELDQLKFDLQISDWEVPEDKPHTTDLEVIRKLESTRIEALAAFKRIDSLYRYLTNLTRAEFRKAVATASPDQQLTTLLEQLALSEQKLQELLATYHPDHPDVKRLNSVLAKIQSQVDDRLDGILTGLKARRDAEKASLDDLQAMVNKYKTSDMESAIKQRPYWRAKRDLESLQQVRDRLSLRIIQEKVDAAIPKSAPTSENQTKRTFAILGPVQKPGVYEIDSGTRMNLLQAIATAGGPTEKGNSRKVIVLRPAEDKNQIFELDADHMAKDEQPIFQIRPGDIITVPAKNF